MKKSDFKRVLSLYTNTGVHAEVCIQIIIQLCKDDSYQAATYVMSFLKETGLMSNTEI